MGEVVPFPWHVDRGRIIRCAAYMRQLPPERAEAHLREQVRRLTASLQNKQVGPERVAATMRAYEVAVRLTCASLDVQDGGAA
jgi:hypothetical protein